MIGMPNFLELTLSEKVKVQQFLKKKSPSSKLLNLNKIFSARVQVSREVLKIADSLIIVIWKELLIKIIILRRVIE